MQPEPHRAVRRLQTTSANGYRVMMQVASSVRGEWRALVEGRLPKAAQYYHWPVTRDHCFARILLDVTFDAPWRDVVEPPAWANAPVSALQSAVFLGHAVLEGRADLYELNRKALQLRGKL